MVRILDSLASCGYKEKVTTSVKFLRVISKNKSNIIIRKAKIEKNKNQKQNKNKKKFVLVYFLNQTKAGTEEKKKKK